MANHDLTGELVLRELFDATTGALKTVPSAATSFAIELDAADGDNVTSKPDVATVTTTTETSAVGMKTAMLYIQAGAAASVKLQVSPVDTGNIWMDVASSTVASDLTNLMSTAALTICARRIRVSVVSGSPVYNLVMQSV